MGCSTKKKIASLCVSVWREREAERVWPDNRRKKIVGEHRKSRRRGSDRECYKLYCISPGKVIGLHLWCWAWTEHLSTATSAGNSHHDNPTQHNRIDLQAEDNSINTASGKHKTCHCRTTWPPAHMRRREMFPLLLRLQEIKSQQTAFSECSVRDFSLHSSSPLSGGGNRIYKLRKHSLLWFCNKSRMTWYSH